MRHRKIYLGNDRVEARTVASLVPEAIRPSGDIRTDARLPYRSVENVIDALSAARIRDVVFLVDERKNSGIPGR